MPDERRKFLLYFELPRPTAEIRLCHFSGLPLNRRIRRKASRCDSPVIDGVDFILLWGPSPHSHEIRLEENLECY